MNGPSLQERYAPKSICFGCGPSNPQGLRIRSFEDGDRLVAKWTPGPHHQAFPGMLNGGIIGALLDCHANWAAAMHLMKRNGWDKPHATVTARFSVELLAPAPSDRPVDLTSKVVEASDRKATVEAELHSGGELKAKCTGIFVAVKEGHPAYHRWE
jgi:acyl-coenzyme A thioesterase PaaI-like protein